MDRSPCTRECPERSIGCHARCSRYLAWKANHDAERESRLAQAKQDHDIKEYIYRNSNYGRRRKK